MQRNWCMSFSIMLGIPTFGSRSGRVTDVAGPHRDIIWGFLPYMEDFEAIDGGKGGDQLWKLYLPLKSFLRRGSGLNVGWWFGIGVDLWGKDGVFRQRRRGVVFAGLSLPEFLSFLVGSDRFVMRLSDRLIV
ncbi:hypothetical protein RHSIM_Rhsim03G0133100 [Rhododendron simsii]|uniref:Uncharacterized protein n=1 Tax=Rhododendron simsii TaxID=118357 RepID=A0A834HB16_RHOSS|nr:hypothetical protein RHSIM_Rhsim03G0133100 [Rhododendron simsii]